MTFELDRRNLFSLGALFAGSGLLAACAGASGSPSQGTSDVNAQPKAGGEIFYLNAFENAGWAQSQVGSWHALQVWGLFAEYLFYANSKTEIAPHLATGYTHNADFTKFNIGIRKGVTFSNGEKLDAQTVALNLNLVGLGDSSRAIPRVANIPKVYKQATAVSDYEVEVALTDPFPAFIQQLAGSSNAAILAPATIKLPLAEQSDLKNTFATGPWVVESWKAGKEVVLKRRDDYNWPRPDAKHTGPAYLEKITIQQVSQNLLRVGALESGQAQVVHYTQPSAESRLQGEGFKIINAFASGSVWGLHIRVNARNTQDVRVREALNRAIDRQEIINTLYNSGWKVAQGPVNSQTPWAVDLTEHFKYDPARANRLLNEAGWTGRDKDGYRTKDGETLEFIEYPSVFITTSRDDLTLIAQQWKKVGVKLTLKNVDYDNYNTITAVTIKPPVPLYEIHWGADYPTFLWRWWHSGQQNQFGAPDKELDTLLEQVIAAKTDAEVYSLAKKVQQFVIENHYFIPVHEFPQNFSAAGNLKGISTDGYPRIRLYDAWLDA
ncbi:ABC transporter substrate-binding protein [Frankia tisae]|uniref:ABC transporter substrate-binding protein n=1 Tax=Frankia tisae TaxID=2950104 RepID=UPI0021C14BCB|nr:ABC transporter substrate-binding protein [Frankia tisae]